MNYNCNKRKPGRPKANETPKEKLKIPDAVNEDLKSFTNINNLHPGILLDYLRRLNNFNKRLLSSFESLDKKYNQLVDKIETIKPDDKSHESSQVLPVQTNSFVQHSEHSPSRKNLEQRVEDDHKTLNNIELKVDSLEQQANNNILICSGTYVTNLLQSNNQENLKESLSLKIKNTFRSLTIDDDDIANLNVFGKNRKNIKIRQSISSLHTQRKYLLQSYIR